MIAAALTLVAAACGSPADSTAGPVSSTTDDPGPTTTAPTAPSPTVAPGLDDPDATTPTTARPSVYYVDNTDPAASDGNPGHDEALPWRTVVHAAATATAGDTVNVKRGSYDDGNVVIANSGTADAPIVLRAHPGHEREAEIANAGISSVGNSHIEVRGFKVSHSPAVGIRFEGPVDPAEPPATDILIADNHTYDTCSSGIALWGVEWEEDPGDYENIGDVVIEDNLLELGTNGCHNEIITVANGAFAVDVRRNTLRMGDPTRTGGDEGIDFKEGVRDSRIHANTIHGLSDKGIYIDGGRGPQGPVVRDITISGNHIFDVPSAGISIVTEGKGTVDGVLVVDNVVHDVEGDGYLVYDHPRGREYGGQIRDITFEHNIAFATGLGNPGHGGFTVNHDRAVDVTFRTNSAWDNPEYDMAGEAGTNFVDNRCGEIEICAGPAEPIDHEH